jgi:hypothetical protein
MTSVVGIFDSERCAASARVILEDAGYRPLSVSPSHDPYDPPIVFRQRGEVMLRAAVKWAIIGALIIEIPSVIILMFLPIDINVRIFMGSTVWKFGAAFGAWIGAISVGDHGLDTERAEDYERELDLGHRLLIVNVDRRDRPNARGAFLESGAVEVRDVIGTFDRKPN